MKYNFIKGQCLEVDILLCTIPLDSTMNNVINKVQTITKMIKVPCFPA